MNDEKTVFTEEKRAVSPKDILLIVGPTAVGKTDCAIQLARRLNGEIISADSMQIYKKMNIGTAKVTKEEQSGVKHHLIDIITPDTDFSVAEFQKLAFDAIDDIHKRDKLPIVSGGTGLYINSILYDMDFSKTHSDISFRDQLTKECSEKGNIFLHDKLKGIDARAAERIHPNNVKRVIRALEINYVSKSNMGDFSTDIKLNSKHNPILIGLNRNRAELYERINIRVDLMIKQGLVEEVRALLMKGYCKDLVSLQGLGYKEIVDYLNCKCDLAEAIEILKRGTRRYAKRQLTWFKRYNQIEFFNITEYETSIVLVNDIIKFLEQL
ncbi:MAG: tRNA (adenosine(37)-N6)-dimethylallyltransferase MiaA [Clostridiales bacterium]|nr:tRNA (adenosine(37)-N6)-dimethylallyltransferase MiaA [Clostridiales bacterium]